MAEFHFLRPYWFIALLPMLVLLWMFWHRHTQSRSWRGVCDPRLLPHLLVGTQTAQRRWPIFLMGLVTTLSIIALAGPSWKKLDQPVFKEQSALVVVFDLSRSMDATDSKPSRLTRARLKLIDLLKRRKEGQTALIVYAADAYVVSPLTDDSHTMVAMVKTLSTRLMPVQGSQPQHAIHRAIELLKQAGVRHGHILLITDGVTENQADALASLVNKAAHQLSVLGVGTAEGAPISVENGGFLKDSSGTIVIPKLDSHALNKLASAAGGRYQTLGHDDQDLNNLMSTFEPNQLEANREETTLVADRWREEGPWLLLLVLPLAALVFRKGYLLIFLFISLPGMEQTAEAFEWSDLWQRKDQQAAKQLQQNPESDKPPSAEVFNDPEWQAAAHYRHGQYQQAVESLNGIDNAEALYNKGNALAKLGRYPEAIQAYDAALKKQAEHEDAKYNKEQVEKLLQQQQSDQNQQSDDQQQSSDKNQDKQQSDQGKQQQSDQQQSQDDQQNKDDAEQQQAEQNQQQDKEQEESEAQQAEQEPSEDKEQDKEQQQLSPAEQREQNEKQQAMEQWLRRIPDDPGGLLRRKFQYEHHRKQAEGSVEQNNKGQPAW